MFLLLPFHLDKKKSHKGKQLLDVFISAHVLFQLLFLCIVPTLFDDKQEHNPSSKNLITC